MRLVVGWEVGWVGVLFRILVFDLFLGIFFKFVIWVKFDVMILKGMLVVIWC